MSALTETVAAAIIACIDGADLTGVRVETEPEENMRGGSMFDVVFDHRRYVILITEDPA